MLSEIIALAAVMLSVGTNVGLYIHLSDVMNKRFDSNEARSDGRFDSIERRLEMMQGDLHNLDMRLTKLEPR
jgi:hypothetical protein